jgi:hypothetical protein
MYCPQCATAHAEGAKFCRSCGTELEAVALVLSGKSVPAAEGGGKVAEAKTPQDWMEKRIEGVKGIASGLILLLVSMLIGAGLALFVPADVPWILVWMVFFGWLAVWGGIEMAEGVGNVIEAKGRLRLMGAAGGGPAVDSAPQQLSSAGEPVTVANSSSAFRPTPVLSVTEGTTRNLDAPVEK